MVVNPAVTIEVTENVAARFGFAAPVAAAGAISEDVVIMLSYCCLRGEADNV